MYYEMAAAFTIGLFVGWFVTQASWVMALREKAANGLLAAGGRLYRIREYGVHRDDGGGDND